MKPLTFTVDETDDGGVRILMTNCTETLLDEIACSRMKRRDVAMTYALAIAAEFLKKEKTDWAKVNAAIMERWSRSALEWIKHEAWKHVERRSPKASEATDDPGE